MKVHSYIDMKGRAQEAIDFYTEKLGAEVTVLMRFKDMPMQQGEENKESDDGCIMSPEMGERIGHATLMFGETPIMLSDSPEPAEPEFRGITLSIAPDTMEQAQSCFAALAEEGVVKMPLTQTFWAKAFGMVDDKFGISWMVNFADPEVTE